jgi:hypothetical protein
MMVGDVVADDGGIILVELIFVGFLEAEIAENVVHSHMIEESVVRQEVGVLGERRPTEEEGC